MSYSLPLPRYDNSLAFSFGALSTGCISGRFGRKKPLIVAGLIYLVGSTIQTIVGIGSSQAVALQVLYFSRFMGGFGLGMSTALIPSYVSECTPKAVRGRCTCLIQSANNLGMMLSCEYYLIDQFSTHADQG